MLDALPFDVFAPGDLVPSGMTAELFAEEMIEKGLVHTIHVSERRAFRSCRQRWAWAYGEDLHSNESIRALEFGQAYHHAMEIYYDPQTWHIDHEIRVEHAIGEYKRFTVDTYAKFVQQGIATDRLAEDFEDRLTSGESMLRHYFAETAPLTDDFDPIEVEIAFEVALLDPDGNLIFCRCDRCWERQKMSEGKRRMPRKEYWLGLPVTIGGRLDALVRRKDTGELAVLDWKTAAQLMSEVEIDFLELDDQISTYLLAMNKLGVAATQFIYHEQRKASPERPEPLNKPYRGRKYQASKDLPTSYELYRETVEEGDPAGVAAGAYDDYFRWLQESGPTYHQRTIVQRNGAQLAATEQHIYLEYVDMLSGRIYPNPSRKQCSWCAFFSPCLGKQRGERYQHALDTMFVKGGRNLSNDGNLPKAANG